LVKKMSDLIYGHGTGARVHVRVNRVTDFGAFVTVENSGMPGMIRRKEISWERNVLPRQVLKPDDRIEAVVLALDTNSQRLILSYRQAVRDTWEEFLSQYGRGATVRGVVKRLLPNGAFVEILPGVDGWLPIDELGDAWIENTENLLWLGDRLEVVVSGIDRERKNVRLSLKERLRQINRRDIQENLRKHSHDQPSGSTIAEMTGISAAALKAHFKESTTELDAAAGECGWHPKRPLRVLLVDDEAPVRLPLAERLNIWGCQCTTAECAAQALVTLKSAYFDLALVDLGLPDMNGLSLAGAMLAVQPELPIAIITGIGVAAEYVGQLDGLRLAAVLLKPLDSVEIQDLLDLIASDAKVSTAGPGVPTGQDKLTNEVDFIQAVSAHHSFVPLSAALHPALLEIRRATRAGAVAVFSMDRVTHSATLEAQNGPLPIRYVPSQHSLEISPVKDVIIEREHIFEPDITTGARSKFRHLLPLLEFDSFIGVPIESQGEVSHGLFLFHSDRNFFSARDFQRSLSGAVALGATIERHATENLILNFQNLALQGQLSAGLAHEINNKLSGIVMWTENLADRCVDLAARLPDISLSHTVGEIQDELRQIAGLGITLRQTARLFQTLMQVKLECVTDVNQVIRTTAEILAPLAKKHNVAINTHLAGGMPKVPTPGVRLEQAFLNIMLNAIQQIAAYCPQGGALEVTTVCGTRDERCPIKVRFADDGPGIHRQLFERVFDLGYTSRQDGSGLGLYLTKGLIQSVGGSVSIEESLILVGTTFLVELPVAIREGTP
jgi:signal transduction histidine kinase/predicted RNA-binding protein with RPS1 domain/DNA-binding response OmpR family regulator